MHQDPKPSFVQNLVKTCQKQIHLTLLSSKSLQSSPSFHPRNSSLASGTSIPQIRRGTARNNVESPVHTAFSVAHRFPPHLQGILPLRVSKTSMPCFPSFPVFFLGTLARIALLQSVIPPQHALPGPCIVPAKHHGAWESEPSRLEPADER